MEIGVEEVLVEEVVATELNGADDDEGCGAGVEGSGRCD